MAFEGYLLKVNGYEVPLKLIQADTYKAVKTIIDLDSYRDADGLLHRNPLAHVPYKIEFNTVPMLTNTQMAKFLKDLNYTESERKARVEFYSNELDKYITQDMYMPDINFQIYGIFKGVIRYDATRIAFIGY